MCTAAGHTWLLGFQVDLVLDREIVGLHRHVGRPRVLGGGLQLLVLRNLRREILQTSKINTTLKRQKHHLHVNRLIFSYVFLRVF